jgi:hypothetical protein
MRNPFIGAILGTGAMLVLSSVTTAQTTNLKLNRAMRCVLLGNTTPWTEPSGTVVRPRSAI